MRERLEIEVRGIVQGVGFRPFVYALACRYGLSGWVRNDADGVSVVVEGESDGLDGFVRNIRAEAPPLAIVESVSCRRGALRAERGFRIEESHAGGHRNALVSPDVTVCDDCLCELFDAANRRFRYPFINCTNCGPRFTITQSVPYDRATTTMAGFLMCPECQREYDDPGDRRFHAQPNACPMCGPQPFLRDESWRSMPGADPIQEAARLLCQGKIVAVKGLGGYHLACNPFDTCAVNGLRQRKVRQDKPFALMALHLEQARELCRIGPEEETLLVSAARPIVLCERREDAPIDPAIALRQRTLGVMLAYTPLHHLLLRDAGMPLVMTSGNRSDEPIAYKDEDAFAQLGGIADAFLTHNRPIHMRCDDSVIQCSAGTVTPIRRSRGYAPAPLGVATRFESPGLACGGAMKNTFCMVKETHAFASQYVGDLENYETLRSFREGIQHYARLFDVQPEWIACDLHPDYLSTQYAREREEAEGLLTFGIQHHHAHIAACLADSMRPDAERVIGVALDGTGYGTDGAIWGGEFLVGSVQDGFQRKAHLEYIPLPGGEAAIRQPWRSAVAQLIRLYGEEATLRLPLALTQWAGERNIRLIARLLEHGLNTPQTSSAGRLFDVVAALVGVPGSRHVTYEGQAAVELELVATPTIGRCYPIRLLQGDGVWIVETSGIVAAVVEDLLHGEEVAEIAARFHRTMAEVVVTGCQRIREAGDGMRDAYTAVALSGGTFQNILLRTYVQELLTQRGVTVYSHRRVPTNDGGLCLGQAVLANQLFRNRAD